jgi:hypothetical protein
MFSLDSIFGMGNGTSVTTCLEYHKELLCFVQNLKVRNSFSWTHEFSLLIQSFNLNSNLQFISACVITSFKRPLRRTGMWMGAVGSRILEQTTEPCFFFTLSCSLSEQGLAVASSAGCHNCLCYPPSSATRNQGKKP